MRNSFIVHIDSLCVLEDLTNEQRGELFYAIYCYQINKEIELSPIVKIAFSQFKNQFLRDEEKYKKTCEARKYSGSLGGKQKVANASNCNQKVANLADSDSKSKNKSKNKNNSDSNNDSKSNSEDIIIAPDKSDAVIVSKYLFSTITSFNQTFNADYRKWVDDIDKAIRIDKRTKEELINCINWIYNSKKGEFWIPNILSGKKLRSKYDAMNMQAMGDTNLNRDNFISELFRGEK